MSYSVISGGSLRRRWDGEALSSSVDNTGDLVAFNSAFTAQSGVYIKHCDSAGTLYIGVGLTNGAADLSSTFPGIDLSPGQSAEIPCTTDQVISVKASTGTIAYCAQRFSE